MSIEKTKHILAQCFLVIISSSVFCIFSEFVIMQWFFDVIWIFVFPFFFAIYFNKSIYGKIFMPFVLCVVSFFTIGLTGVIFGFD